MAAEIHVDDIGTRFRFVVKDEDDAIVDISSASLLEITFQKPSGTELVVTGEIYTDGTDGIMYYQAVEGDLNEHGHYKVQGRVEVDAGPFHTTIGTFRVYCNL